MVFLSERISKHVFKTRFRINVLDVTHIIFFEFKVRTNWQIYRPRKNG